MKKENDILELMVSDIKNSNYSPFEKYIGVYNIVKKFKKYKENKDNKTVSRNITSILNNEYMVCVGYAELLNILLAKVGINSYCYSVSVDVSYDEGFTKEEKEVDLSGHERIIFHINDPKYDINGFYQADPTWDNDLENDYYNHALISFEKNKLASRYFRLNSEDLILNSPTFKDFEQKINFIINRNQNGKAESLDSIRAAYCSVIVKIFDLIKNLNPNIYAILKEKYKELLIYSFDYNIALADEFLTEIGNYFVENYGKDISFETIVDAACNVNKNVFNFDESEFKKYKEELFSMNINRDKEMFPFYYNKEYNK